MKSVPLRYGVLLTLACLLQAASLTAQSRQAKKYPSLLWEITGNGLKKPSYLFGTMHVSSKLVFHLSDSFYLGIRNADMVALELDPLLWQDEMFRFDNLRSNLRFFTQQAPNELLNQHSFQLEKCDDELKAALSEEPTVINSLLYRTYLYRADFEEDTYLDMYIYQTGRRLGKPATGVENYFQTEHLVMEAAQDMMKDKRRKTSNSDRESPRDLERKSEDAYRQGDLDMLDSLEKLMEPSASYMEKFLYRRNEIQAASIDSIVHRQSLFVGVGAAHLPGKRGVIELLRKKGYTVRPVIMSDHDDTRRDDIDKIKVPVTFTPFVSEDGDFSVMLPGKLYRRAGSLADDSWEYADMSNGAYYMIGRVKTHGSFLGQSEEAIRRKVDSVLYENIPGKILTKTLITRGVYQGFDITSRTRRGDNQRYNILITPYEVWIFKMSGNGTYIDGPEAAQFFGSIRLRNDVPGTFVNYGPAQGGFSLRWPRQPRQWRNSQDGATRWEYEATDSLTGNTFLLWKKTLLNYRFLEEDTVNLALMEESFRLSKWIDKPLRRHTSTYKGYACMDAEYLVTDGSTINARFLIHGPDYYTLAVHGRKGSPAASDFFNSLEFTPYRYPVLRSYVDTFMHVSVTTPPAVVPDVDANVRGLIERESSEEFLNAIPDHKEYYWPHAKSALFRDDSTGEAVFISIQNFPKYYYPKDSSAFWEDEFKEKRLKKDFILGHKHILYDGAHQIVGYDYTLSDTNTLRQMNIRLFISGNRLFRIISLGDSLTAPSEFIKQFYASFHPEPLRRPLPDLFESKLNLFFSDFNSKDSLLAQKAKVAIPEVYFGPAGVPILLKTINSLRYNTKDYLDTKTAFIKELGFIRDSASTAAVVEGLKKVYERTGDTSTFQNGVLKALALHQTREAYTLLRQLIVQDPPIFENSSDYQGLFESITDSLALAKLLFPDLLQLASVDDYKYNIQTLLATLVDSGYMRGPDYESWLSQVYFDAKIQWKKQEAKDEEKLQKDDDANESNSYYRSDDDDKGGNNLDNYAVLLSPFYDKNPTIPRFFDKLLTSKNGTLRLNTAILLLRQGRLVADSILRNLASDDAYRGRLYQKLADVGKTQLFPAAWLSQELAARSLLVNASRANELADIQLVGKEPAQFRAMKGTVYFFKYKVNKDDDWLMGVSGIQPSGEKGVSTDDTFVSLTGRKLQDDKPVFEQFNEQWKRLCIAHYKGGYAFYQDYGNYNFQEEE